MSFVNRRWFDRHDALLMARGASPKHAIVAADGSVMAYLTNGGIAAPHAVELHPPLRLVRLGQGGSPLTAVQGGWWLRWSEYQKIERYADARGMSLQVAVRWLCAVPLDWSTMDMIVQVRLKSPLLAYEGVGSPALHRDAKTGTTELIDVLDQGVATPISQLFIPGLGSDDVRHDALMFEGYGHLPAHQSKLGYIIRPA